VCGGEDKVDKLASGADMHRNGDVGSIVRGLLGPSEGSAILEAIQMDPHHPEHEKRERGFDTQQGTAVASKGPLCIEGWCSALLQYF
jgi:hypothetical protein